MFQEEGASVSEISFQAFPACGSGLIPDLEGIAIVGWKPDGEGLPRRFGGLKRLIRSLRPAGGLFGLWLRLHPKRLRSLGVFKLGRRREV